MIYTKVSQDAFSYICTTQGNPEPSDNAKKGQIYPDISARCMYQYDGKDWVQSPFLSASTPIMPYIEPHKERQAITNCPNCGAPYEGKNRCEYCGTYLG